MLPPPLTGQEKIKQQKFFEQITRKTFELFNKGNPYIIREEVSYIMRYLGQCPSEFAINNEILPEVVDEEPPNNVSEEKFIPYMVKCLELNVYEPSDFEYLMEAFKKFDPEQKGYVDVEFMREKLSTIGIQLREKEVEEFIKYASPDGMRIYYEDYVRSMTMETEKHMDKFYKKYEKFLKENS